MLNNSINVGIVVVLMLASTISIVARDCDVPPTQGAEFAWSQWSLISVNVSTQFSGIQRDAIKEVFDNWTMVAGSGVSFEFTFNREPIVGLNTFQIDYVRLPKCPDGLETCQAATLGRTANGRRFSARMQVGFGVSDTRALKQVVSHEIGHTFGLDDCVLCGMGTSAMNLTTNMNDNVNGRASPSRCDVSAASTFYSKP